MKTHATLSRERAMLLVIDMQTGLLPYIKDHEQVVAAAAALLETAAILDLPVMATVQYVKGLGPTHERLAQLCAQQGVEFLEKAAFSACRDERCRARGGQIGRDQVIVTGIEAHVCVQQTVLDLLSLRVQPYVCADAVSSRRSGDLEASLGRMRQAGAIITTTEAVLFELCELSGTAQFKKLLAVVKGLDKARNQAARSERHGP